MDILETERLTLRPWRDDDRAPLAAIFGDAEVRRFYPNVLTPEETSAQLDGVIAATQRNGFHFAAAELKSTGRLIGFIGLGVVPDNLRDTIAGHPRVEIGWQLDKAVWGQGLAPEGARAWLDYGWNVLKLEEIVAFTAAINRPSQRVMEKLGMTHDAADDFDHPKLPEGHRLRPHVLYRIKASKR
jgi:RimJ/RimL family protein N-acetyltransferase